LGVTDAARALLIDYGGVLTSPPADSFRQWLTEDKVDPQRFRTLMRTWFGTDAPTDEARGNIAYELETGRLSPADFEARLARELVHTDGSPVESAGVLSRMFAGFTSEPSMVDAVRRLHAAGVKTALVSNSWGFNYPREGFGELFDAVVISGEEGIRKPDAEIYLLAAKRLDVPPEVCVFVDDLAANIRGAAAVGMIGVHHTVAEDTIAELEILFERSLR
jgi:putative hydrolase of the HAD superfamily